MLKVCNILILLSVFVFSTNVSADDKLSDFSSQSPSYSFEMQGGFFYASDDNWSKNYGGTSTPEIGLAIARRFLNVIDIGGAMSFSQSQGTAVFPVSQIRSGKVYHKVIPVELFVLLRGRFSHKQWIVPYIGGGYTRLYYQQILNNVTYARGAINGVHARAGLQFLLDPLEPNSASQMYKTYGVLNSYLFLEGKVLKAETDAVSGVSAVDLGGRNYRLGIMLEY